LTEGAAVSLLAERIRCSAKYSSIAFGLENVASFTPSAINLNARSTLLIGAHQQIHDKPFHHIQFW